VAVLLIALIVASFHHTQLGLQMVLEDYLHDEGQRLIWLTVTKAIVWLLGLAAVLSVLKLAI
jgi:succinate dehydrogenase / fumarate reductase membrane anchor subunit